MKVLMLQQFFSHFKSESNHQINILILNTFLKQTHIQHINNFKKYNKQFSTQQKVVSSIFHKLHFRKLPIWLTPHDPIQSLLETAILSFFVTHIYFLLLLLLISSINLIDRVLILILLLNININKQMLHSNKQPNLPAFHTVGPYRYRQSDLLGSGYQSQVYKAYNAIKKNQVALKIIHLDKVASGINRQLLDSQLACLQALRGTLHVINLLDIVKTEKIIYVVTELCKGDLGGRSEPKLPEQQAWRFIKQLIKGYKALYQKQIIHRDIKPDNMFLKTPENIKIGDFGFAAHISQAKKQSKYNIGSPSYMAPQVLHRNDYSPSSDIWSIGVSYFQLLTGKLPWTGTTESELIAQITRFNIGRVIENCGVGQESKKFLRETMCFDACSRITPEELFQYQVFPIIRRNQSSTSLRNCDKLSTSTIETIPKIINSQRKIQTATSIQNLHKIDNFINSLVNNPTSTTNKQKPKYPSQKTQRRMSLIPLTPTHPYPQPLSQQQIDRQSLPNVNLNSNQLTVKSQRNMRNVENAAFKKKHKTSLDINLQLELEKDIHNFSIQAIDKVVHGYLQLANLAKRFLEDVACLDSGSGSGSGWGTELNVFKICLRNNVIKTIQKIQNLQKSDLLEGVASREEIKQYIKSDKFKKTELLIKDGRQRYQRCEQLKKYWPKAKDQKPRAYANAGYSLINALKNTINPKTPKQVLQKIESACILTEMFVYLTKNKYFSNEIILGTVKIKKNAITVSDILSRIQVLQKLK